MKKILMVSQLVILTNCSNIIQNLNLSVNSEDEIAQQEFNVEETTLTISVAKSQSKTPYLRQVIKNGHGEEAGPISESYASVSNFPTEAKYIEYLIGPGDTIKLLQIIENKFSNIEKKSEWPRSGGERDYSLGIGDTLSLMMMAESSPDFVISGIDDDSNQPIYSMKGEDKVITATGRIGSDGSVLLLEVGRLEAEGKTLNELRSEVRNILIRNGVSPRFQLEILDFKSKRAYLTINEKSVIISLNDQKTDLRDVLSSAGQGLIPGVSTQVKLQRNRSTFIMKLRDIFSETSPEVTILDRDHIFVEDSSSKTTVSQSIVGEDGNIILQGIGKISAVNKTLVELEKEIASLSDIPQNSENAFKIEFGGFASQTALVNVTGSSGAIVTITNKSVPLAEILTGLGVTSDSGTITRITLKRGKTQYSFTLKNLLKDRAQNLFLQADDQVLVDKLAYKANKVFILGGITPNIINIDPAQRETLADILFTSGGVLGSTSAKRSEVYLLRGSGPVQAYHLDAQNPTRLIVADFMELRPNDILFVAEQPIVSFNRALATIVPLRILLRDIQDNNIP